jgi:hypothetical protein|tara:strand:- start:609 stop:968 length:360 start_codon:yes stop_codon:yes gene_type:complete
MHKTVSHEFHAEWMNARYCDDHECLIVNDRNDDSVNIYDLPRPVMIRLIRNLLFLHTASEPAIPRKWSVEDLSEQEIAYLQEIQAGLNEFFAPPTIESKEVTVVELPKKRGPGRPRKNR